MTTYVLTLEDATQREWTRAHKSIGPLHDHTEITQYETNVDGSIVRLRRTQVSFMTLGGMGIGFRNAFTYETEQGENTPEITLGEKPKTLYKILEEIHMRS